MDSLIIFSAKYLIILSGIIFLAYLAKQPREKQKQVVIFSALALPVIFVVARISSLLYFDPRPFVVGNFLPLIPHVADNGFPSDHTLLAGALSAVIFFYDKKISFVLLLLAVLVGGARVLAGVHHVVDVLGSIGIAFAVAFLLHKFALPILEKFRSYERHAK